jgi:hypothetical protein
VAVTYRLVPEPKRGPVTMQMAGEFDAAGLYEVAEVARRYAVDRPRWSLTIAVLRLYYRLTGRCLRFRPGPDDVCRVCRWER